MPAKASKQQAIIKPVESPWRTDMRALAAVNVVAIFVRLYNLNYPTSVVFDEVHFGGFASKYIKGKFFMDVHPPLAKMLFAAVSYAAGFDGEFDFKEIGKDYLEPGVPYVAMRMMPALLGIGLVSTAFLTLRASGCSRVTAVLAALLVTFENGLLTNARLILLDSPLITFTGLTAWAFQNFTVIDEDHTKHLTSRWWLYLTLTGLFLGATVSVKWVGLFTIGWVGLITLYQLFTHLGNLNITLGRWTQVFAARVASLIVLPVTFYMLMFAIHFVCLVNPGDGDGFMSSEFQSTLNTKALTPVLAPVSFGNTITLKHHNTQGGFLHSHVAVYPGGSKQQQITLYPHKDANNNWVLHNETQGESIQITDGAVLKFWHPATQKRLHSHDVRPIVSEVDWQNEASAYGFEGFDGDANDLFRVEIQADYTKDVAARTNLTAIASRFRLIHVMTGCALFSHKVKLPSWGFEQQEVTCAKQGTIPNSIWYIEANENPTSPDGPRITYSHPGFLGKFWELNKVMWRTNAGLVESHNWDSRPSAWPLLKRGINFWGKEKHHVYLLGNALVWGLGTAAILAYVAIKGFGVLRWQRGFQDYTSDVWSYDLRIGTYVLGWAFHYLPFYLMQRQLFLHHYFPSLYFSILAFAQLFDFAAKQIPKRAAMGMATLIVLSAIGVFWVYSPLAYGLDWTKASCERTKLVDTWDFDCQQFPHSYSEYGIAGPVPTDAAKPVETVESKPAVDTQAEPMAEAVQEPAEATETVPAEPIAPTETPSVHVRRETVDGTEIKYETLQSTVYQDEAGNILDPEIVKQMQNVKFVTRYDTIIKSL